MFIDRGICGCDIIRVEYDCQDEKLIDSQNVVAAKKYYYYLCSTAYQRINISVYQLLLKFYQYDLICSGRRSGRDPYLFLCTRYVHFSLSNQSCYALFTLLIPPPTLIKYYTNNINHNPSK